jgi:hypothetical protein
LGIHGNTYDDYYFLRTNSPSLNGFVYSEAVAINTSECCLATPTTGVGWPEEQAKKELFCMILGPEDKLFVDLS